MTKWSTELNKILWVSEGEMKEDQVGETPRVNELFEMEIQWKKNDGTRKEQVTWWLMVGIENEGDGV